MGRGVGCIKSTALIEALRWLRGAEPGRVSQWVWGAPLLLKSYNVLPTQLYCPWFSGFGSASFQSVLPVGLFNCSQPHDVQTVDCRNSVCRNRVCRNSVVYPNSMQLVRQWPYHFALPKWTPNTLHVGLTSSNKLTDRFSKFFHCHILREIYNTAITKYLTSPQTCRYTALWNSNVRKLVNRWNHSLHRLVFWHSNPREVDTIPTDSVLTNAIPTIHSQDDPVRLYSTLQHM